MLGQAKTSAFMLSTATVLMGPLDKLWDLNAEEHSLGLVKNFRVNSDPTFTKLTQGVRNTTAYQVATGDELRASMEVYEYTGKNLAYSLGLEGSTIAPQTVSTTTSAITAAAAVALTVTAQAGFAAGDWVTIQYGAGDVVYTRKLSQVSASTLTFVQPLPKSIPAGAVVRKVNALSLGSTAERAYLSAKVIGQLADKSVVTLLCPKVQVSKGFSLGFVTENFDNLPFEWTFFDLLASDPYYADFRDEQAKLLTSK